MRIAFLIVAAALIAPSSAGAFEYPGQTVPPAIVSEVADQAGAYWDRLGVTAPPACAAGLKIWQAPDLSGNDMHAAGRGDGRACEAWILEDIAQDLVEAESFEDVVFACEVITHEVGHARGLPHSTSGAMADRAPPVRYAWTPAFCISRARTDVLGAMVDESPAWIRMVARDIRELLRPRARYLRAHRS